ncbi:ComF family protein [Treponema sp. OMZ 305]|uniref:ComF family protein n=1 Tax=Treponema sp. OMZ 305 TaxID=1659192 RepID=UPI0020A3743B|nr:ComF family protein [Treponema sp. OMZ 305]UTC57221.1 ComF family protein [Treponema sp. OMZ 305]
MKRIVPLYHVKNVLRKCYSGLLCPLTCILCGNASEAGLPLCSHCIQTEFEPYIGSDDLEHLRQAEPRCKHCGKILISEHEYCTRCRPSDDEKVEKQKPACDRIFTLFPYIGLGQKLLPVWKNNNIRSFSTAFAPLIHSFLTQHPKLMSIPLVPVPPRPKKLREKGWDQIEDLVKDLSVYPKPAIYRCLRRQDSTPQKKLSKTERAVNLQGKIKLAAKIVPETLILLDDVMTTGATLEACARALKVAGCKNVYGLCLFFD